MSTSDILGISFFGGFGLWLLAFPRSAILFYRWVYRGKAKMPHPWTIRIFGAVWILLIVVGVLTNKK